MFRWSFLFIAKLHARLSIATVEYTLLRWFSSMKRSSPIPFIETKPFCVQKWNLFCVIKKWKQFYELYYCHFVMLISIIVENTQILTSLFNSTYQCLYQHWRIGFKNIQTSWNKYMCECGINQNYRIKLHQQFVPTQHGRLCRQNNICDDARFREQN